MRLTDFFKERHDVCVLLGRRLVVNHILLFGKRRRLLQQRPSARAAAARPKITSSTYILGHHARRCRVVCEVDLVADERHHCVAHVDHLAGHEWVLTGGCDAAGLACRSLVTCVFALLYESGFVISYTISMAWDPR